MKYQFQSKRRNVQIEGVGEFRDYFFQTDNEVVAEKVRKNAGFNMDIFESPGGQLPLGVKIPKGPKVKVFNGMRTSEANERENE